MREYLDLLIETQPSLLLALGAWGLMVIACEGGYYWHRRSKSRHGSKEESGEEAHVLAAALGLLALMLAFTFSMAQGRHDDRRDLLVKEAGAIVATYLQVQMVDQPGRDVLNRELQHYVDIRLRYFDSHGDRAKIDAYDRASEAQHVILWETMLQATKPHRATTVVGIVSAPMAEMINAQGERKSARIARVPTEVMQALVIYALISAFMLGYIMGGHRARHRIVSTILFALIAVAMMVTLDLDSPTTGGIQLSAEPLLSAQAVVNTPFDLPVAAQ